MTKVIECVVVEPSSGCSEVARGQTEEDALKKAVEHTKKHGVHFVSPLLMAKMKEVMRDEK